MGHCPIVSPRKSSSTHSRPGKPAKRVSLKVLADRLGLSPATVSLVMNRSAVADSIPQETKDRIFAAAHKYHYRPNFVARSLRKQRSFIFWVILAPGRQGIARVGVRGL